MIIDDCVDPKRKGEVGSYCGSYCICGREVFYRLGVRMCEGCVLSVKECDCESLNEKWRQIKR